MQSFKDARDYSWNLAITVSTAKAIKAAVGIDLLRLDESSLSQLSEDIETLVGVLWTLCEKQAAAASVTPEEFADRLHGDAIDAASEALLLALADFFPRGRGDLLRAAVKRARRHWEITNETGLAVMGKTDWEDRLRADLTRQMEATLGGSGTPSPEPSASIPADSASESSPGSETEPPAAVGTTPQTSSP